MEFLWLWIVLAVVVLLAIVAIVVVVSARKTVRMQQERVDAAWSSIVAHVAARGELLRQLHELVGGVAGGSERAALTEVASARAALEGATEPGAASAAEDRVQGGIRKLLQVAEGYPALQRDQEFLRVQGELAREGSEIQTSRRHFNGAVREYNTKIRTFPGSLVASGLGATPKDYFEVNDRAAIAAPPKVQF